MADSHTPGPWFVEGHGLMDATRSRTICIFGDSEQDDADLALAASAPELRRVIEEGVELLRRTWPSSGDFAHYAQMWVLSAEAVLNAE